MDGVEEGHEAVRGLRRPSRGAETNGQELAVAREPILDRVRRAISEGDVVLDWRGRRERGVVQKQAKRTGALACQGWEESYVA